MGRLAPALSVLVLLASGCSTFVMRWTAWEAQASGTRASLRGVCAVSVRVCWVSGSEGTVLRTLDGGRTWQRRPVIGGGELDFRDVHAWDAERALVLSAGSPAHVFQTEDGGATWVERHRDARPGVFFDAFAFWDEQRGIAFSDPVEGRFVALVTEDGGATWREVPAERLPAPSPGEAGFAASGTSVAVMGSDHAWIGTGGSAARVLRTTDRGRTWAASDTPLARGRPSAGVFSLAFGDPQHGIAVGGDYEYPGAAARTAAWTEDGGATWHRAERWPRGYRSCVAWVPAERWPTAIAVGPGGIDVSVDGGRIWYAVGTLGYHAVAFTPRGDVGWAVGSEGRIACLAVR